MSVTQYYKTVKLTIMEAATVYAALGAHADKLRAMLEEGNWPAISEKNMRVELAAADDAMVKLSHAKADA